MKTEIKFNLYFEKKKIDQSNMPTKSGNDTSKFLNDPTNYHDDHATNTNSSKFAMNQHDFLNQINNPNQINRTTSKGSTYYDDLSNEIKSHLNINATISSESKRMNDPNMLPSIKNSNLNKNFIKN